jgi:hypothetical protein
MCVPQQDASHQHRHSIHIHRHDFHLAAETDGPGACCAACSACAAVIGSQEGHFCAGEPRLSCPNTYQQAILLCVLRAWRKATPVLRFFAGGIGTVRGCPSEAAEQSQAELRMRLCRTCLWYHANPKSQWALVHMGPCACICLQMSSSSRCTSTFSMLV